MFFLFLYPLSKRNFVNFFLLLFIVFAGDFQDQSFQFIRNVHRVFIAMRNVRLCVRAGRVELENIPWELNFVVGITRKSISLVERFKSRGNRGVVRLSGRAAFLLFLLALPQNGGR